MTTMRPNVDPTWATDALYTNGPEAGTPTKVAPAGAVAAEGFRPTQRPPAQHVNYKMNATGQLAVHYKDIDWLNFEYPNLAHYSSDAGNLDGVLQSLAYRSGLALSSELASEGMAWFGCKDNDSGGGLWGAQSQDGYQWTSDAMTASAGLTVHPKSIKWSERLQLWIVVFGSAAGDAIATSPDGEAWTARTDPAADTDRYAITEDAALVCVARGAGGFITSPDGITWTERTHPAVSKDIRGVHYSSEQDLFVACGSSNTLLTSADGITWTDRTANSPIAIAFRDVTYDAEAGLWIVVGAGGVITSPDGTTWTDRTGIYTNVNHNCVISDGQGVTIIAGDLIAGVGAPASNGVIARSDDGGINREYQHIRALTPLIGCVFGGGRLVLFGGNGLGDAAQFGVALGLRTSLE